MVNAAAELCPGRTGSGVGSPVEIEKSLALRANVAVIDWSLSNVIMQTPVPEQGPDHPVKLEVGSEAAVSVTVVPGGKSALHVAPQLIPLGALVTVPRPLPAVITTRSRAPRTA